MPSPQPTLNPITNPNAWLHFVLCGVSSPGTIAPDGIRGFKRETGWDEKAGKGTQGATLTLKTIPPTRGSILLQLVTPADFAAWDAFVLAALAIPTAKQQAQGLDIYYPAFSSIGLSKVVVKNYEPPKRKPKLLYVAEIELIEWQQPPPVSVVATVAKTKPDQDASSTFTQPPDIAAKQAQLALLRQQVGQ